MEEISGFQREVDKPGRSPVSIGRLAIGGLLPLLPLAAAPALTLPSKAEAGIVIVGDSAPVENLLVAGEEDGKFVQYGAAGDPVEIYGKGFTGTTAVRFGGQLASFTVRPLGYEVDAITPPGTGTVPVTVTTPEGTNTLQASDYFTYTLAPTPPTPTPNSPETPTPPTPTPNSPETPTPTTTAATPAPRMVKHQHSPRKPNHHKLVQQKHHNHPNKHHHGRR